MARPLRVEFCSAICYVMVCSNQGALLFRSMGERELILSGLGEMATKTHVGVHESTAVVATSRRVAGRIRCNGEGSGRCERNAGEIRTGERFEAGKSVSAGFNESATEAIGDELSAKLWKKGLVISHTGGIYTALFAMNQVFM